MKNRLFISLAFFIASTVLNQAFAGSLKGQVIDSGSQDALMGANVILEGIKLGASTDLDGYFQIGGISPGTYDLKITMLGFQPDNIAGIVIDQSELDLGKIKLMRAAIELQEVVVKGPEQGSIDAEINERMNNAAITDAVVGEEMKMMPDPDVASVVRRTTGVSSKDGNPIIRGLGKRYSKVTLNNSQLAGTEPNESAVSLDLFPSSMMEKVSVSKSFMPDQFGEFGGGTVNMNTWDFPGKATFNFSLSASTNDNMPYSDFRTYSGGNLDFLGFDDGTRAVPNQVSGADTKIVEKGMFSNVGFTSSELEAITESFANNWSPVKSTAVPNLSYSWNLANKTTLFGKPLGYMISNLYKNSNMYKEQERNIYKGGVNDEMELWHNYDFQYYTNDVVLGGMSAFEWEASTYSNYKLSLLYNHDTENETRYFEGYNDDRQKNIQDTRLRFISQSTLNTQLSGNHLLPSIKNSILNWDVSFSRGTRYEPDTREVQYEADPNGGVYELADETQSGSRIYSDLYDNMLTSKIDWTIYIGDRVLGRKIKSGLAFVTRHRDSETRFFQFEPKDFNDVDITQNPEDIFAPENLGPEGYMVSEYTRPTDSYQADHNLGAVYAMVDYPLTSQVRITGGVRVENSDMVVTSYELFSTTATPVESQISTLDVLPAVTLTYSPWDKHNFKFAASQTVSRPDFRELSEFEFTDIIGGSAVIGNPNLERALIQNFDLRWERSFHQGGLFSISTFYKHFDNPIEIVIQPTAQHRISYENAQSAHNYGIEVEYKKTLATYYGLSLEDFSVSTNFTLLESTIELSDSTKGVQTSSNRQLQGQSPYLFNFSLSYNHPHYKTQVSLFYNVFGKRIVEVGSKPLPDVYELPHPELDLTFRQPVSNEFSVKGGITNLLDSEVKYKQGDYYTLRYKNGRTYSIGITYIP